MKIAGNTVLLDDGRLLHHHQIHETSLDVATCRITVRVGSWESEKQMEDKFAPLLLRTLVIQYADWQETHLDNLPEAVQSHPEWENTAAVKPSKYHEWAYPDKVWKIKAEVSLESIKEYTWKRIKTARTLAEQAPFECNGYLYDANKAQISGAVQMALLAQLAGQPFSIDWTLKNNTTKSHDASEMLALGIALGKHVSNIFDKGRRLREQIDTATTVAELDAINWE